MCQKRGKSIEIYKRLWYHWESYIVEVCPYEGCCHQYVMS